jgi:hypothetical protein
MAQLMLGCAATFSVGKRDVLGFKPFTTDEH